MLKAPETSTVATWVAKSPTARMNDLLGDRAVIGMTVTITLTNISLQRHTEFLEAWLHKYVA